MFFVLNLSLIFSVSAHKIARMSIMLWHNKKPGGLKMSVTDRIHSLRTKHQFIHRTIIQEMGRPLPDCFVLRDLKVRKLRVKEEIMRLEVK